MTLFGRLFVSLTAAVMASGHGFAEEIDFERDIRPIFSENCTICHGPDDQKGGLRLTGIEFADKKLKSGNIAVLPGHPERSALVSRINATDPDDIMPPPGKAPPLTEQEKRLLSEWIREGAVWPKHWAYTRLERPAPPPVKNETWIANPIDHFVLARLEDSSVTPSPPADNNTLIRRLFCDLIGLVPTAEQLDHYNELLKARHETGLDQLIDDLLASRHFGERWGRHWLDKARYADSDGYEKDNGRPNAWRYRDWVIEAINNDMPFDQFTIEQFGGDLLAKPTPDQFLATAFNRQTLTNTEGGTDQEQWRVAAVMDRVETMGSVWLGLTLTCARCHTHKYDEITQHEYYRLFTYFNNGDESTVHVPRSKTEWATYEKALLEHQDEIDRLRVELRKARENLKHNLPKLEKNARKLLKSADAVEVPGFQSPRLDKIKGPKGVTFSRNDDGSVTAGGENPDIATYSVRGTFPSGKAYGIRLETLPVDSHPARGPGRVKHGNFVLNHIQLLTGDDDIPVIFSGAEADHSQDGWPVSNALDPNSKVGKDGNGWAIGDQYGKPHSATFAFEQPLVADNPRPFTLKLVQNYGNQHTIGRFRLSVLTTPTVIAVPKNVRSLIAAGPDKRKAEEATTLLDFFEKSHPEAERLRRALASIEARLPAKPEMKVRIVRERTKDRRATHVFHRGEFKQPGDRVSAGTPEVLPPIKHRKGSDGDRLDLARWLVSGENPLPPRMTANQIWTHLFGRGLVTTLSDFGVRGERPSHPALLNWLAAEFVNNGWSRKQLIKTIVTSNTYRQASHHRPELRELDPKNNLLARQNRFRVDAELIRDFSLGVAGLLSAKVGGPSVFPPIPDGVADVNYNSAFKWKTSPGPDKFRRGIYTYFKRTAPHPNLTTFDCPDSNVTCVQRTRSNTPLAALITLNNGTFAEAARGLAGRLLREKPATNVKNRIEYAFRICLSRPPTPAERDRLEELFSQSHEWYANNEAAARAFAVADETADDAAAVETAAWAATVRVLLNLDEFLTRN